MSELIIIGAGITGLSAGYHAEKRNIKYQIFEQESQVGGLCRTLYKDGFYFDISGHVLSLKDQYIQALVRRFLKDNLRIIKRNAAIYSKEVFTRYPFQVNLYGLPRRVISECLREFVKVYFKHRDLPPNSYRTFHDLILAKFGKGIARHFMFPYNSKFWTVPVRDIVCDWVAGYIPMPSLEDIFNGAFGRKKDNFGHNAIFWYPSRGGIQPLCDNFAERLKNLHLNKSVRKISLKKKELTFNSGEVIGYTKLISTMPLKELIAIAEDDLPSRITQAARKLKHNSVLVLNIGVKGQNLTDKHWVYLPEKKYAPYRVGTYTNFSKQIAPPGTTSYYAEIAYRKDWNVNKDKLINRTINDMLSIGFIRKKKDIITKDVFDIKYAYVIYDKNYSQNRKVLLEYLRRHNIFSIGRYGGWEYSLMESAMQQGKNIIDKVC